MGFKVRLFCSYEHVTLLTDSRWAIRIGQLCSENTGSLVRLSVSLLDVAKARQSSWRLYPDVAFSWKTVYLSLPLDPTEDIFSLVSFLVDLLTHSFFFRAKCPESRACIVFAKHA